ncbi:MAG: DUF1614 domain-containing protein [Firmicutes bacterium]|nr:DUF1614 domain-containing protein [Bacillota bacterium]
MFVTNLGMLILIVVTGLIFLGFLHRVLDRMRLTKGQALTILLAMLGAGFLPNIPLLGGLSVNIGGALVPIAVAVYLIVTADEAKEYLIVTADEAKEKRRALITSGVVAVVAYLSEKILPLHGELPIDVDPLFLPAIVAAITAYVLGRSRRAAFVGGVFGVILTDVLAWSENWLLYQLHVPIVLGSTGVFGAAVIGGMGAVLLAELLGETLERIKGGPQR